MAQPRHARTPRATWNEIGFHRLAGVLLLMNGLGLLAQVLLYRVTGLTLVWSSAMPIVWTIVGLLVMWGYFAWMPGSPREWIIPQAALVMALLLVNALVGPPMQYPAVALGRPLVDPWLAAADARLGISVAAIVDWTASYRYLVTVLRYAYASLLAQFLLPVILLPVFNDREALWEYAWHFTLCSFITITCLGLWPAACVFTYEQFPSLLDQTRFVRQFADAHAGTPIVLRFDNMEGLVSVPSFHVAGAWMVTWAFRRTWIVVPLVGVNLLLTASTVLLGAHYAVDLLATLAMVAVSLGLFRAVGQRLMSSSPRPVASPQ